MDFGALPPEANSGRMYVGPGPATLLAAAAGWDALAAELHSAADAYQAVVTGLTDEPWTGQSSMSMVAAVAPYLRWMRTAAVQCEEAANRATAAATAYETAFAMTVPPPAILANRVRLATLIATNSLGQNTPAIAATEAKYSEMWAQDATVMYNYAASAATTSAFKVFTSPRAIGQSVDTKAQTTSTRLMSAVTQSLEQLVRRISKWWTPESVSSSASRRNQAQEYRRGPCAPAPAECFCQAWAGISAGRASTRIGPAWVGTRRLAAMAITYPRPWPRITARRCGSAP